jgi:serine phosphatase RsbU (regulator of sigma subunit)
MFGFDRTRDIVASAPSGGGLQTLLLGQQSFVGEVEQEDDITLIALNRLTI